MQFRNGDPVAPLKIVGEGNGKKGTGPLKTNTSPWRSTAGYARCRTRRGIFSVRGICVQRPSGPYRQPWNGHWTQSPTTLPFPRSALIWEQLPSITTTCPASVRYATRFVPSMCLERGPRSNSRATQNRYQEEGYSTKSDLLGIRWRSTFRRASGSAISPSRSARSVVNIRNTPSCLLNLFRVETAAGVMGSTRCQVVAKRAKTGRRSVVW